MLRNGAHSDSETDELPLPAPLSESDEELLQLEEFEDAFYPCVMSNPEEALRLMRIYARYPGHDMPESRLKQELAMLRMHPVPGCTVDLLNDNLYEWTAKLVGPVNTPYEGGIFDMHISIPFEYPFQPPILKFVTKIYHCNVHGNLICTENWSPVITVGKLLFSVLYVMETPDPTDPLNPAVANLYINHRREHDKIARQWTLRFAVDN